MSGVLNGNCALKHTPPWKEMECEACGAVFEVMYRQRNIKYCHNCRPEEYKKSKINSYINNKERRQRLKKKKKRDRLISILELQRKYFSIKAIAKTLGLTPNQVSYSIKLRKLLLKKGQTGGGGAEV